MTEPTKEDMLYMGRPILSMTKDELVEALILMNRLYSGALESHIKELEFLRREVIHGK